MAMNIIDTHSHIYLPEFDADRNEVVQRATQGGVNKILLPNIDSTTMDSLMQCARSYPGVCFPMAGLHPTSVRENYKDELASVERDLKSGCNFVAVGEIGIDLYWDTTYRSEQLEAFDAQLSLAAEHGLPVAVHCRDAFDEMFSVLSNHRGENLAGVAHSFSGTIEQAQTLLETTRFYLGINGIVTFKNSALPQVLKNIPIERIVPETDSPYLAPVPHRGKRNESLYVVHVVEKIAEIYGMAFDEAASQMHENAATLFNL